MSQPKRPTVVDIGNDATVMRAPTNTTASISAGLSGMSIADGGEGIRTQTSWSSGLVVSDDIDAPKVLKQRFVLEERIGSGGMGTVFRARDLRKVEARDTQPFVAIKVLNNDFRQHPEAFVALEREASKSQSLRHSNIVSIFDFDKDGDVPFITMELLEGAELSDLLRTYPGGLPRELAWTVIRGMVEGLKHAHHEGVVHADFKPGNIFVTDRKATKILDFGIARAIRAQEKGDEQVVDTTQFDPGRLAALTPAYASREMLQGDNPEVRDDLYSLGVVIYMLLTGRHPYGRLPADDAAREQQKAERIRELTRRQWRIINQCLSFNRQDRPRSIDDVYDGLFDRPAWQRYGVAAGALTITAGTLLLMLVETSEIDAVKDEVRQETLLETQTGRVRSLLDDPQFDKRWADGLATELARLRDLDSAQAPAVADLLVRDIDGLFAATVQGCGELSQCLNIFEASHQLPHLPQTTQAMQEVLITRLNALRGEPVTGTWLEAASQLGELADRWFVGSTPLAVARSEVADAAREALPILVADGQSSFAAEVWAHFEDSVFDIEEWQDASDRVSAAVAATESDLAQKAHAARLASLQQDLDRLLNVSCLRLEPASIDAWFSRRNGSDVAHVSALKTLAGNRLSLCVERLTSLDPGLAGSLASWAGERFALTTAADRLLLDACAAHHLIDNGAGRQGFCVDTFNGTARSKARVSGHAAKGPQLVVVGLPQENIRLAVSRYETSGVEYDRYCANTGACEPSGLGDLPIAGVGVEAAHAYAGWLTDQTGFTYRLPTVDEWRHFATETADPNRNCKVDIGGVRRGNESVPVTSGLSNKYGIHNVLGNVRELVSDGRDYRAAGGGFDDPINSCERSSLPVYDHPDSATGFRLVREIG